MKLVTIRQVDIAKHIGIVKSTFSARKNGKTKLTEPRKQKIIQFYKGKQKDIAKLINSLENKQN